MNRSVLFLSAAATSAVVGVIEVVHDQPEVFVAPVDWVLEVAFAASMAFTALALWALRSTTAGRARVVWLVAAAGASAVAVAATATAVVGQNVLGPVFGLGLLAVLIGYLALLVLDLRRRISPAGSGLVLFVSLVASITVESTGAGGLVLAAGWLAVRQLTQRVSSTLPVAVHA